MDQWGRAEWKTVEEEEEEEERGERENEGKKKKKKNRGWGGKKQKNKKRRRGVHWFTGSGEDWGGAEEVGRKNGRRT